MSHYGKESEKPPTMGDYSKKVRRKVVRDHRGEIAVKTYLKRIPQLYQGVYEKAMSGKSKAAGIKAHCLDCCAWQRVEVPICGVPACPLYPYRPYQKGQSDETED